MSWLSGQVKKIHWATVKGLSILAVFVFSIFSVVFHGLPHIYAASERPAHGEAWPICSSAEQWYCIESASRDMVSITDGDGGENIEEGGNVSVNASLLDDNSVNWAIRWSSNANTLPDEVANQTFRFTLRTGTLEPNFTYALSNKFYLTTEGNADDGYKLNIEATPTRINWLTTTDEVNCWIGNCGDDTTTANIDNRVISGNTQNMALWDPGEKAVWKGAYLSSNAQYRSTVPIYATSPDPYWSVDVGNPHLTVDEQPADGSFTAWVPPTYFETLNTTAADAVANGFSITRDDDGDTSTVLGAAAEINGGAYLRIPSITYSTPSLIVSPLSEGEPSVIEPDAPSATAITPKSGGITIDYDAPVFNGGSGIIGYEASCTQGEKTFMGSVGGSERSITIYGMTGGVSASCSVKAENSAGQSDASNTLTATPNAAPTDEEDLNNDLIPDTEQPYVSSTTNTITGKTVAIEMDQDCDIQVFTIDSEDSNSTKDAAYSYSNGLVNFTAVCGGPGQAPHIKLFYYNVSDDNFAVRKYNPNAHAYFSVDDAEIATETIYGNHVLTATYQVTDGDVGDVDGEVNGTIVDPVGLAKTDVDVPNTGLK